MAITTAKSRESGAPRISPAIQCSAAQHTDPDGAATGRQSKGPTAARQSGL
jgi:hypothetical protein